MTEPKAERIVFCHQDGVRKGDVDSFEQAVITIGRSDDSNLRFDTHKERSVSAHHAVVRYQNNRFELVDTRSTNGTYVNGRRVERVQLEDGDLVRFGALGPEIRISMPSRGKERTIHDGQVLVSQAGTDVEENVDQSAPIIDESVLRLRHWRFARTTVTVYLGAAGAFLALFAELRSSYDWQKHYLTSMIITLVGGLLATITLAYFHGRPGRQRMTRLEILLLILITAVTGLAVWQIFAAAQTG